MRDLDQGCQTRKSWTPPPADTSRTFTSTLREHAGDRGGQTRTIFAGDVDQDDFGARRALQEQREKLAAILTAFDSIRARAALCRYRGAGTVRRLYSTRSARELALTPSRTTTSSCSSSRSAPPQSLFALRIACHSLLLPSRWIIYAWVIGMQFKHAMQQQADAIGESLIIQTSASASELLVANDILSLNVLLANLVRNPLVAHAAIYSVGGDSRVLAEAGSRPPQKHAGRGERLRAPPTSPSRK